MRVAQKASFLLSVISIYGIVNGIKLFFILILPKKKIASINFVDKKAPIYLRQGTSDVPTFKQIFIEQSYETDLDITPQCIIDCGANIGLSVRYFRSKYPDAKIVAIEADKDNFEMLKKNTSNDPNIILLHNGVWHKKSHLKVVDVFNVGSWGFSVVEVEVATNNTIEAISINEVLNIAGVSEIGLLKIDIEGSEKELFENQSEAWLPSIRNLIIETHDKYKTGTAKAVLNKLLDYEFSLEVKNDSLIFKNIHKA